MFCATNEMQKTERWHEVMRSLTLMAPTVSPGADRAGKGEAMLQCCRLSPGRRSLCLLLQNTTGCQRARSSLVWRGKGSHRLVTHCVTTCLLPYCRWSSLSTVVVIVNLIPVWIQCGTLFVKNNLTDNYDLNEFLTIWIIVCNVMYHCFFITKVPHCEQRM